MWRNFETVWISYFFSNLHQLILVSISGSSLQHLVYCGILTVIFYVLILHLLIRALLQRTAVPSPSFFPPSFPFFLSLYQYEYFIVWIIIQHYYLFCWSSCSRSFASLSGLLLCPLLLIIHGHLNIYDFSVL